MLRITKGSIFLEIPNGRTAGIEPQSGFKNKTLKVNY